MQSGSVTRSKVALRSTGGCYVCAEGGGGREVNVTRKERGIWETFELIELPQPNKVALRAFDGHYMCPEEGGGGKVVANRDKLLEWETFELIKLQAKPTVKIALRAYRGQYLCAEMGGGDELTASRSEIGPWESPWVKNSRSSWGQQDRSPRRVPKHRQRRK
jgi:hypothetical protein